MLQYYESHRAINRPSGPICFCSCGHEFSLQVSHIFGFNESYIIMNISILYRHWSFSDRWIAYCDRENIPYKIVNCYDSNIIAQVADCDALMWHHHHGHMKDVLAARKILFALEHAGVRVFPDFRTAWHFDDKVAQKYLLEAIDVPLIPSYVFYDKQEAINWAKQTSYPKVFKLKGGAGSSNVKLVKTNKEARKIINKAF